MGNAMKVDELSHDAIQLDVRDALSAALQRAEEKCPAPTILELISSDEWKAMDETSSNILVFDPE